MLTLKEKKNAIIVSALVFLFAISTALFAVSDFGTKRTKTLASWTYLKETISRAVNDKLSVRGFSVEAPMLFFPYSPQRLLYVASEISAVSEELVARDEELLEFTKECDCKYAESQCRQVMTVGYRTTCEPGSVKVFGESCPTKGEIDDKQSEINDLNMQLSFLQELLKTEMETSLEWQLKTLRQDDAQALRENLEKLLALSPKILEPSQKNSALPDDCNVNICEPDCELAGSFELEACLKGSIGQQKQTEIKFGAGVGLNDLELGEVKIKNINLSLPEEIEVPALPELPALTISVPDITLGCPTEQKSIIFRSPGPALPAPLTLKLSCPQYPNYSSYSCSASPSDESQSFIEAEWYFKTFSHLSENCLNVIQQDLTQLTTAEAQNAYQELMKKCLKPEEVSQTIINECNGLWDEYFDCLGPLIFSCHKPPEICQQIGPPAERNGKAVEWCEKVLEAGEVTPNTQVCIDDRPGLIYERNGSLARVYISGTNPGGGAWGWNCGGDPGFWNTNDGKVLVLEWDWATKLQSKVKAQGERGSIESPAVDTGPVTYTKPDSLTGTETIKTVGGGVYSAGGAQWPTDRRVRTIWAIPGIEEPTPEDCSSNPIETLRQKCAQIRNAGIEEVPLSCKLLPLFSGQLEDALPDTIIGGGGSCPAQTTGDYPEQPAGCAFAFPSVPKITFPKIIIPDIRLPSFNFPPFFRVKLPSFIFEDLVLPDLDLCNLDECQFQFPDLSFQIPSLKIPTIAPSAQVPGFPQIEVEVAPIEFRPLSFQLPQLINLGSLVTPELEIPQIPLPQPTLQFSFKGIKIDLANLLLGLFQMPSLPSGCISIEKKFTPLIIEYPNRYFYWPAFPRIPEIPFCQSARQFCKNAKGSIQEITTKTSQIQNQFDAIFQKEVQDKLNKAAKIIQQDIESEIQQQLDGIAQKISEKMQEHIARYAPEAIPPPEVAPVPGVWIIERELPCEKIPPLTISLADLGNKIVIEPIPLSELIEWPDKISIIWPPQLKKFTLTKELSYELPTIPLSLLSYSEEHIERLPGFQRSSPSINLNLLKNATACLSQPPSGGNPCPTDKIQSNLEEIKRVASEIEQTSQSLIDVLY